MIEQIAEQVEQVEQVVNGEAAVKVLKKRGRKSIPIEDLKRHRKDFQHNYYKRNRMRIAKQRKESRKHPELKVKRIMKVKRLPYGYSTIMVSIRGKVEKAHTIGFLAEVTSIPKSTLQFWRKEGILPESSLRTVRGQFYTEDMANSIVFLIGNNPLSGALSPKYRGGDVKCIRELFSWSIRVKWDELGIFDKVAKKA